MSLSAQEKSKIIKSMNELKSKNIDLSKKFYEIFLQNEEISTLFKFVPIETQKKMFKVSLESIIFFMDNPNQIKVELLDIGKRHKRYGVKRYHIPLFKASLLQAINLSFEQNLSEEMISLWEKVIDLIVSEF